MKAIFKIIAGFILCNSIFSNLRQEGIVSGQIVIDYPKLINKISRTGLVVFTDSERDLRLVNEPIRRTTTREADLPVYSEQDSEPELEDYFEDIPQETSVHIMDDGETLISLASIYGVPWQKIKEMNGIDDVRRIHVGQKIWIPAS